MLLMGESINGTRKQVAEAIQARDAEFIKTLATDQVEAGAGLLDVNGDIYGNNIATDSGYSHVIKGGTTANDWYMGSSSAGVEFDLARGGAPGTGTTYFSINPSTSAINLAGKLLPVTTLTYDVGSAAAKWNTGYFNSINATNLSVSGTGGNVPHGCAYRTNVATAATTATVTDFASEATERTDVSAADLASAVTL